MNVPKLRFKEFDDAWKKEKLKTSSVIYDGTHETPNYISNGIKFVSVENINNIYKSDKYISEEDYNRYKVKPVKNDIFMTRIGDIGTSNVYDGKEPIAYYVSLALIRTSLNPLYLNQYIKSTKFQKELHNRTIHVAFPKKINTGEIGECNISKCSPEEQNKLANFLSLLDKKIELQSKKVEALKLYKMCIINNLFKEAKDIIRLKDICDCKPSTLSIDQLEFDVGEYKLYGANGMIKSINNYLFEHEYLGIIKDGASVGKTMICDKKSSILGTLNALFPINVDINYLNILINRINFQKYIVGSGIPHIYFKDYRNESLIVHSKNLQEKIGLLAKEYNKKILYEIDKLNMVNLLKKDLCKTCLYRAFLYIKKD